MSTIGFVTIGQSPRADVLGSMFPGTDESSWNQSGALDVLDAEAIRELAPSGREPVLVTRLRDGSEAVIAKPRLLPYLEQAISRVAARGAGMVVVLCTGEFPHLQSPVPLIYPDRILSAMVEAIYPSGTLGVVMPHAGQQASMLAKWQSSERQVVTVTASPYSSAHELEAAGRYLTGAGAEMILLDCMGFDESMRGRLSAEAGVPTILANRLTGRVLEEMMTASTSTVGATAI